MMNKGDKGNRGRGRIGEMYKGITSRTIDGKERAKGGLVEFLE